METNYKTLKEKIKIWLGSIGYAIFILPMSWTFRTSKKIKSYSSKRPVIYAIWHNSQYAVLSFPKKERKKLNILISNSNDGEMIAKNVSWLGFSAVRGSTNRGGTAALRGMLKILKKGENILFTVDGPKGPVNIVKEGIIKLAQISGSPIIPLIPEAFSKFVFNGAWDKYEIPTWLSKGLSICGEPIFIPKNSTQEELENYRLILQNKLFELKKIVTKKIRRHHGS